MDVAAQMDSAWKMEFARMTQGDYFLRLASDRLEVRHYMGFLRETYFNAACNPRNMALFIAHLGSDRPDLEAKFLKHTAMEIGHDALALEDYGKLGGDTEALRRSLPLPTTEAMAAFITFQIQHRNPLSYLGYLYHLEALPVHFGPEVIESLLRMGVPLDATTFLREHAEADPVHLKWNREYLEGFIRNETDLEAALYGLKGTCRLHAGMFQGILEDAEDWRPAAAPKAAARL